MSEPFIAEIRMFAGDFAPRGWAFCDGQILSIAQNTALFSLLGTTYGGDGKSTFALPDLRARVPVGAGQGAGLTSRALGELGGASAVVLTPANVVPHTHVASASTGLANTGDPNNARLAATAADNPLYVASPGDPLQMGPNAIGQPGPSAPHENLQPYVVVSFIIALVGVFPPRS